MSNDIRDGLVENNRRDTSKKSKIIKGDHKKNYDVEAATPIDLAPQASHYSFYRRHHPEKHFKPSKGKLNIINSKLESLDYDTIENDLLVDEEIEKGYAYVVKKGILKWISFLLIGFFTAVVASSVDIIIDVLTKQKFTFIVHIMEKFEDNHTYVIPLIWMALNFVPFMIGVLLVTYLEPIAGGSGIPLIRCYLNGISVPRMLTVKTLTIKAISLVCTMIGGAASGKEGPMIHMGGSIAGIIARGEFCKCSSCLSYRHFRDHTEKRDFVSAGAACGVSAAFGAPIGGVLFSLEEGASFWNQNLTWRIFCASVSSTFFANLFLSAYKGYPGQLSHPSLINLEKCDFEYRFYELPIFMIFGVLGGLMGSLWNYLHYNLMVLRLQYLNKKWIKVVEAGIIINLTAIVAFLMTYTSDDCKTPPLNETQATQVFCRGHDEQRFNMIASMWLRNPQHSISRLLHNSEDSYSVRSLALFGTAYYFLSCGTLGLSTSTGLFIPCLLIGATWGRFWCIIALKIFRHYFSAPTVQYLETVFVPGKYALILGAGLLGGIVRMTLSLTVIIMETSDNISFSFPIMLTLICAKYTGQLFTDSVYDILLKLHGAPFLKPDVAPLTQNIYATEIMSSPVICFKIRERVGYVVEVLKAVKHNGFPIVETSSTNFDDDEDTSLRMGKIKGVILRKQVIVMITNRFYLESSSYWEDECKLDVFKTFDVTNIEDLIISDAEMILHLDFSKFMNRCPFTLMVNSSMPQIFHLFRGLGLRHLPIVNNSNRVVGIITRKDLAKYRHTRRMGKVVLHLSTIV